MFERLRRGRVRDTSSDEELHRASRAGNEDALAALYLRHGPLIYRFSLSMCQDASLAEEVTQEVFLALLIQGGGYEASRAALSTWLCGIARRQVWKHLEKRRRALPVELMDLDADDEPREAESSEDDPAVTLTRKETLAAVRNGVDALPAHLKEVIVLCEFEEMTYEEAASVIAVPVGTIRSRLFRAKARLKSLLTGEPAGMRKESIR